MFARVTLFEIDTLRTSVDTVLEQFKELVVPEARKRLGGVLAKLYARLDALRKRLEATKRVRPEQEFDLEREFQAINKDYDALAVKLAFEEVLQ